MQIHTIFRVSLRDNATIRILCAYASCQPPRTPIPNTRQKFKKIQIANCRYTQNQLTFWARILDTWIRVPTHSTAAAARPATIRHSVQPSIWQRMCNNTEIQMEMFRMKRQQKKSAKNVRLFSVFFSNLIFCVKRVAQRTHYLRITFAFDYAQSTRYPIRML